MTYIQILLSDICARVVKLLLAGRLLKKPQVGAGQGKNPLERAVYPE